MSQSLERFFVSALGAAIAPIALVTPSYAVQYLTIEEAKEICFSDATQFEDASRTLSEAQKLEIEKRSRVEPLSSSVRAWRVFRDSELLGMLFWDQVIGKHLLIDYVVAVNVDGSVKQIEILEYRENYGGEIRDTAWRNHFIGKTSASALKLRDDIPKISGATYSTLHITEGVRRLLTTYDVLFK